MTTMDSDSESQDSDDGRRFRFEATRKDPVAPVDTAGRTKTLNKKSKHKSSHCESSRHYWNKKERSKHESDKKTDDKDPRHSIRHLRHESRNSRQEDNKNSSKEHRDSRGMSAGSAANDRGSRNSSGSDARERSRDSKRQSDRDRSSHRARERSYERNYHDERASGDKHRSRYHERYNYRSRDKSRERSHQSSRVKSSNGDYRSREDHGGHDSFRKISVKENRSQNSREPSPKIVERERSHSEGRSSNNTKKDSSIENQDCKDLDLSQFDVLSETDENMSDGRDSMSRTSSPHKLKRHSGDRSESSTRTLRENDAGASDRKRQEEIKVKRRNDDSVSSSYNNNPSAVSDISLDSESSAMFSITRETCMDFGKENFEHCEEERMIACDERSDLEEIYKRYPISSDDARLLERDVEQTGSIYGPFLPPGFASNPMSHKNELEKISSTFNEDKIHDKVDGKSASFIGPCLPPRLDDRQSAEREDTVTSATETDAVFGPILPPHLLQRQRQTDTRDNNIIGPVLPSTTKHKENSAGSSESDDDCAIGPLPVDHPALRTSRVHEQLDLRAQRIKDHGCLKEEVNVDNKREEWMTELPPAQAANLGLGPRTFRLRDGPDMSDRSCWTDTPAQRAQKQKDMEAKIYNESDKEQVKEFHKKETNKSRKREKSLLEMHQSKVAKKKRKEEKEAKQTGPTRRPFDRDIDLQTNRLNQAQKKTVLLKAQLLDDRFSRGQI